MSHALEKSDPKYKKYAAQVSKALASFDAVNEWADFISFLGRLSKTLASSPLPCIPDKLVISKRLAQCLNPALPAGVHQKALEVYGIIFHKISVRYCFQF